MKMSRPFHKKLLCASVASVLGLAVSGPLSANTYELSVVGAFTMINGTGYYVINQASPYTAGNNDPYGWKGNRTPITGTMSYDTAAGTGTFSFNGFFFFGRTLNNIAKALDVTVQAIGDGTCTNNDPAQGCATGSLLLGNLMFSWNKGVYPVSTVWDAQGFLGALPAAIPGTVIQNVGKLPASNNIPFKGGAFYPLGATPLATTTWNTTNNPACPSDPNVDAGRLQCASGVPSGVLPLWDNEAIDIDGNPNTPPVIYSVSSSPIVGTSFDGFNASFDIMKLTVTKICNPNNNCVTGPPTLVTKAPADGQTQVPVDTAITLSFTNQMRATSIVFSLKDAGGTTVNGTLSPNTGDATNFTFTPDAPLSYTTTYTATLTTATDTTNLTLSGAPIIWSFTTGEPPLAGACTPVAQVPGSKASNFTMLNGGGGQIGGTNDIAYSFTFDPDNIQPSDLNTHQPGDIGNLVSDTKFNMTLASTTPQPFFGHTWTAHDIRVFGPGDYDFDTTCTVADLHNGIASCNHPLGNGQTQRLLHMHVGPGQIGAHMLFDWNLASNIDVVNVWDRNAKWNANPITGVNLMFERPEAWGGPAGLIVNPNTTWKFVSTDNDGDGVNGVQMVDGSFISFNANFNLGASDSCQTSAPTPIVVGTINSASSTGCSISTKPSSITVFERSDWLFVGGFLAWLGALRFRTRRATKG
jgi:hypothetical protein